MKLLKNNRFLLFLLVMIMVLSLTLNGCTKDNNDSGDGGDEDALAPVVLRLAGGSEGGTWQLLAGLISEVTARNIPGSDVTVIPGSGSGNSVSISKKNFETAIANASYVVQAYNGRDLYEKEGAMTNLRQIMYLEAPMYFHIMARKNLPNSIQEIVKSKHPLKYSAAEKGSTHEAYLNRVLGHYSVTADDIKSWGGGASYTALADAIGMFRDGHIDMILQSTARGSSTPLEMMGTGNVKLLSLEEEEIQVLEDYGLVRGTIPAGTYVGQDEDINTTYDALLLFTNEDIPDDVVYSMTKAISENIEFIITGFNALEGFAPSESAATDVGVPLHPGAIAYYKERGWID